MLLPRLSNPKQRHRTINERIPEVIAR